MGDQPLSNSTSETYTHVDSNDIRHSKKGCQTSSQLGGEPRALDLIGLQSSALLVTLGRSVWTYMTGSIKVEVPPHNRARYNVIQTGLVSCEPHDC